MFSLLLLIVPVAVQGKTGPRSRVSGVIVYFSAIGVSFMLLEVSLMQRLTLFLGHPVYATAWVLAVLMLTSGLGSAFSRRFTQGGKRLPLVCAGIAATSIAYSVILPIVLETALRHGLPVRIAVAGALLVPLGFLLGMPFPVAIASLTARQASSLIGWAWAANGFGSVLGPLLAVLIAMDFGFDAVAWIAAIGYGVALAAFGRWGAGTPGAAHR
jgi:MFS family permease